MKSPVSTAQYGRLLITYLKPLKGRVLLLVLLVLVGIALQLLNPQLIRRFLDGVESGQSLPELVWTAVVFTGIAVTAQLTKLIGAYVGEVVAWRATNELRADLALHCLQLDMSFHKAHKPGELIERVDGDVNLLANFFSQLIIQLVSNFLLIVGVLVLLWLVDWRIGAAITVIMVLGLVTLNWFNKRLVPRWQALRQVSSDLFGYLEEWLGGTEEIQTNAAAPYIMNRLYGLMRERWHKMQRAMRLNFGVMSLPTLIPALAYIAAYLWGAKVYTNELVTIGTVYLIFYYIDVIKGPLWVIQRQVQDLQQAAASMNRIVELLEQQPTILDGSQDSLADGALAVRFETVSFSYADDPETLILDEIDFTLAPGRILGLLGRTGSGKSTLTRLLYRFYDPTVGSVCLGDGNGRFHPLPDLTQATLRQRIGMVTQEVQLFHASLRDNLTLFNDTIDDDQILAALTHLGLRDWLNGLPAGLDTALEAGKSLSAGEAQLLALGRVFLADPGLVILDEASSRLDPATEHLIERALDTLLAGRTVIIIAHRLATVQRADEIMILENGRLLEHGNRLDLVQDKQSRFYQLLQTGMADAVLA
ncbi:MAG: ABC transporter ATP-binding protein [Anaerolineae bacterium]|nr:ABC transporter ATP-binding protein [Anaerolineae bacterium]